MTDLSLDLNLNVAKEELAPLSVEKMMGDSVTDFDLYIKIGGHVVLYAPSPYKWSQMEIERLRLDGHNELLYDKHDQAKVNAYEKISLIPKIDTSLPPKERIKDISDVAAEMTKVLFEHAFSEAILEKGKQVASAMIDCIQEDPMSIRALGLLSEHDQYTYYHSGRIAAYSVALAIKMSMQEREHLEEISLGCLMHDIGKSKVDIDILNKRGPLTEKEWSLMRKHPQFGLDLIDESLFSIVPLEIILHHHERHDGKGYPHGLGQNEILEEVNIAAFSDIFDALTSNRPYQKSRSRFEALDFIRFHMLDQINKDVYKAMVDIFSDMKE